MSRWHAHLGVRRRGTDDAARDRSHVFVLSGGGPRGAAQAGAAEVLLAAGIVPSAIIGCSVGALNAAFLAAGPTVDRAGELGAVWRELRSRDIFSGSRLSQARAIVTRRSALFDRRGLDALIRRLASADRIEELAVPLRVVTTSLATGRAVYHDRGPLLDLLCASAALPGLFPPAALTDSVGGTAMHVDGGVTDLVPATGALEFTGATDIWVVDVAAAAGFGSSTPRSALDVVVASLSTSMRARELPRFPDGVRVHLLDCSAENRGPRGLMDFTRADELIEVGRRVAAGALLHTEWAGPVPSRPAAILGGCPSPRPHALAVRPAH